MWRQAVSALLVVSFPVVTVADDTAAAMLRATGAVVVDGGEVQASIAIFSGALIETRKGSFARIEAQGTAVDIGSETVVRFEGDEIYLEHGSVSVNTSRSMRVRAGCVTVVPVNVDWTQYETRDLDGKVVVAAIKNDVNIESHRAKLKSAASAPNSTPVTVKQGDQASREDKCAVLPAQSAASESPLNSPYVKWSAVGVASGVICWLLCRGGEPASPSKP
jgi:hypothetical protein